MSQVPLFEEIGDPQLRRAHDFYETARWQVEALLRRIPLDPRWLYVEPCAGDGAIVRPLRERGLTVVANDLVPRTFPLDLTLDAAKPSTWNLIAYRYRPVDVIVTNVPFNVAFSLIPLFVDRAQVLTISLLRSTWDEPTLERADWLAAHPPTAQIAMPRHDYRGTGDGDSATHHWFIWAADAAHEALWNVAPHSTVTPRERDELIAQFGER